MCGFVRSVGGKHKPVTEARNIIITLTEWMEHRQVQCREIEILFQFLKWQLSGVRPHHNTMSYTFKSMIIIIRIHCIHCCFLQLKHFNTIMKLITPFTAPSGRHFWISSVLQRNSIESIYCDCHHVHHYYIGPFCFHFDSFFETLECVSHFHNLLSLFSYFGAEGSYFYNT